MGCDKLSARSKCCIACCAVSVVVLAVMIPVGLFVIGPHVAQHVLDNSVVSLPNLTQAACPKNYTWLINHVSINVPGIGPVKAESTIEPYTQEVWTTACLEDGTWKPAAECSNPIEHMMGSYSAPKMSVSPGDNKRTFNVSMESDDNQTALITSGWVIPLFLSKEKTRLILKAKDVQVKVMGISFKGLTMRNEMTCQGSGAVAANVDIPANICHSDAPYKQSPEFTAICTAGSDESIDTTTTTAQQATTTTTKKAVAVVV